MLVSLKGGETSSIALIRFTLDMVRFDEKKPAPGLPFKKRCARKSNLV